MDRGAWHSPWGHKGFRHDLVTFCSHQNSCSSSRSGRGISVLHMRLLHRFSNIYKDDSQLGEDAGLVDGINQTEIAAGSAKHYGLGGVSINGNAKGIHIVNGKKYIVK